MEQETYSNLFYDVTLSSESRRWGGGKVERTNDTDRDGKQEKATIKVSRTQREHDLPS